MIPGDRISPIAQKLIALVPQPNLPGAVNNYYVTTPIKNRLHRLDSKVDWNATSKLRVAGGFGYQPYNSRQNTVFGDILAGGNNYYQHGNVIATAVSATYIVTPNFVIDGNWGLTRANQILEPPSVNKRLGSDYLGIPGTNLGDLPLAGGMPQFNVNSYTDYGYSYPYLQYLDPIYQYTANASWVKGAHNVRFGVDVTQQHMDHKEVQPTSFSFNGGATSLNAPGAPSPHQYNSYADFLLGLPQSYQNSRQTTPWITLRTWQYSLYVRDQWQVSRKLTLSYGTRWEYYPVPSRADRGIELYDFATNQVLTCGVGGNSQNCGIAVSRRLFSPRISVAYRPMDTFVIRAGYALNRSICIAMASIAIQRGTITPRMGSRPILRSAR
jgi:hypothetical protein